MSYRRPACAGLALAAMIALTGCDPADDRSPAAAPSSAQPSSSAATTTGSGLADARSALSAAAARLADDSARVKVSIAGQMTMTGVLDPRTGNASMQMDMGQVDDSTQAEIRQLGPDVWIRLDGTVGTLLGADGQWLHIAADTLATTSNFNVLTGNDPAGVRATVAAATEVRRTGPTGFAGVLDLTRTSKYSAQTLAALGSKASAVPFTAAIDRQGRLIRLTVELSSLVSGAGAATTWFSDFGVAVQVDRPPAAESTELPSGLKSVIDA